MGRLTINLSKQISLNNKYYTLLGFRDYKKLVKKFSGKDQYYDRG